MRALSLLRTTVIAALAFVTTIASAALTLTSNRTPSESFIGQQVVFTATTTLTRTDIRAVFVTGGIEQSVAFDVNRRAVLQTSFSTGGTYSIVAKTVLSDGLELGQSEQSTLSHLVLKSPSSVILNPDPAPQDQSVRTFNVRVNVGSNPVPATGTVELYDLQTPDTKLITTPGVVTLDGQGRATFTASVSSGTRRLFAAYRGDANYDASVSFPFATLNISDDVSPNPFSFSPQTNVQPLTLLTSNTVAITGISTGVAIAVANGSYSIGCNGNFTSQPGTVTNNASVCVRQVSACKPNESANTQLTVGTGANSQSAIFTSTVAANATGATGDCDQDGVPDAIEVQPPYNLNPTIKDNNLFDANDSSYRLFVAQLYRDFLLREADAPGRDGWVNELRSGRTSRAGLLRTFYGSNEYQASISPITRLYLATYLRIPDLGGLRFWTGEYRANATQTRLIEISNAFVSSPEFNSRYGQLDNNAYVTALYTNILNRAPTAQELARDVARLGSISRGQLLSDLSESADFKNSPLRSAQVLVIAAYNAMLNRMPSQSEFDTDTTFTQNSGEVAMLQKLYNLQEYAGRFVASAPASCSGTMRFTTTALTVAENVGTGRAAFNVTRSDGNGSCTATIVLCEATDCGTTAIRGTDFNVAGTNFSATVPGKAIVTFAPGATTASAEVAILNNPAVQTSAVLLKAFLRDVSYGVSLVDDVATLTITDIASSCPYGVQPNGQCIPSPFDAANRDWANLLPRQPGCFSDGGLNNPCRAYQIIKPAACPAGITNAFQYPLAFPALQGDRDFGAQKFYFLGASDAIIFAFKTPEITGNGVDTAISFDNNTLGAEAIKFVTISETPCDFSIQKFQSQDLCYQSGNQTSIELSVSNNQISNRCTLRPNRTYYLSVRSEDVRQSVLSGQRTSSCPAGSCGYLMNGPTLLFPRP